MLIAKNEADKKRIAYIFTTNASCKVAFDSCIKLAQKGVLPLVAIGSKQQTNYMLQDLKTTKKKVIDPKTPCVNRKKSSVCLFNKSNQNKKSQQAKKNK